jgi:hypothetical protein
MALLRRVLRSMIVRDFPFEHPTSFTGSVSTCKHPID